MRRTTFITACALAATVWGFSTSTFAQRLDAPPTRDLYFTFSQPVVVPARTLPAGKYLFRVVGDGRSIVQIFAGDGSKLVHTAMTVHAMRADQPERPEIRLIESAADTPSAIGTWWYPEMRQGWEFVYPREQALRMAKTARQPILTTAANVPVDEAGSGELVRLDPSGSESGYAVTDNRPVPVTGMAQTGDVAARDASRPRPAATMAGGTTRTELPRTASSMPAIALVSVLALAAAAALGLRRRAA